MAEGNCDDALHELARLAMRHLPGRRRGGLLRRGVVRLARVRGYRRPRRRPDRRHDHTRRRAGHRLA